MIKKLFKVAQEKVEELKPQQIELLNSGLDPMYKQKRVKRKSLTFL